MHVARWGNSLAVRLPKALVKALDLKPGDAVEVVAAAPGRIELARNDRRAQALARMRARGWTAPAAPLDRDALHER